MNVQQEIIELRHTLEEIEKRMEACLEMQQLLERANQENGWHLPIRKKVKWHIKKIIHRRRRQERTATPHLGKSLLMMEEPKPSKEEEKVDFDTIIRPRTVIIAIHIDEFPWDIQDMLKGSIDIVVDEPTNSLPPMRRISYHLRMLEDKVEVECMVQGDKEETSRSQYFISNLSLDYGCAGLLDKEIKLIEKQALERDQIQRRISKQEYLTRMNEDKELRRQPSASKLKTQRQGPKDIKAIVQMNWKTRKK